MVASDTTIDVKQFGTPLPIGGRLYMWPRALAILEMQMVYATSLPGMHVCRRHTSLVGTQQQMTSTRYKASAAALRLVEYLAARLLIASRSDRN